MALTFPPNPNVGDSYLSYIFDGVKWGVQAGVGGVAGVSSLNTRTGPVTTVLSDITSATGTGSTAQSNLGMARVAATGAYADISGAPITPAGAMAGSLTVTGSTTTEHVTAGKTGLGRGGMVQSQNVDGGTSATVGFWRDASGRMAFGTGDAGTGVPAPTLMTLDASGNIVAAGDVNTGGQVNGHVFAILQPGTSNPAQLLYYLNGVQRSLNQLATDGTMQTVFWDTGGGFQGIGFTHSSVNAVFNKGVGMFGATPPAAKPAVTGSRAGNAALASLISQLLSYGIISDSTTA